MKIAFITDFHAQFLSAFPVINHLVVARNGGAVIFDSGDFLGESFVLDALGPAIFERLQEDIFDTLCPGNHGFGQCIGSPRAVCCNVVHELGNPAPWQMIERGDIRLGVIGIIGRQAFNATPIQERAGFRFVDPLDRLPHAIRAARQAGANQLLLLSHCGYNQDIALARDITDFDVILSGHCHSDAVSEWIGKTLVVKAPEMGGGIGYLTLGVDGVTALSFDFAPDPTIACAPALNDLRVGLAQAVAFAEKEIGPLASTFSRARKERQVFLQNVLTALQMQHPNHRVILNLNVFRDLLPTDILTEGALYDLMPFDNMLVTFEWPKSDLFAQLNALPEEPFAQAEYDIETTQRIMTTDYVAQTYLGLGANDFTIVAPLRAALARFLTEPNHNVQTAI
ncbi:MAG: hypothetical protein ABJN34_13855 [Litoreibacter sp.]|uniref:hypothetical protein n=1 Tax=Litoreibacter sp. TaxID=1969459 RepID=UPI003297F7D2